MTDTYLTLIDKLNRWKAELRCWQVKEQQAVESIQSYLMLQSELKDQIENLEDVIAHMRFSDQPKSWFIRGFR